MLDVPNIGAKERDLVTAVRSLIRGRSNAIIKVTLTPNTTTTVVTAEAVPNLNESAFAFPAPLTANAAAAMGTTFAVITRVSGELRLTITHASSASTDRTFAYAILGG